MKTYLIIRGTEEALRTGYEKTASEYKSRYAVLTATHPLLITNGKDYDTETLRALGETLQSHKLFKVSSYEMNENNLLTKLDMSDGDSKYILVDVGTTPDSGFEAEVINCTENIISYCTTPILNADNVLDFNINRSAFYVAVLVNGKELFSPKKIVIKTPDLNRILSSRPRNDQKKALKAEVVKYLAENPITIQYVNDKEKSDDKTAQVLS